MNYPKYLHNTVEQRISYIIWRSFVLGHYCPKGTLKTVTCPFGTYNPSFGISAESECLNCTAGMYCGSQGLEEPSGNCSAGYFCSSGASTKEPTDASGTGKCSFFSRVILRTLPDRSSNETLYVFNNGCSPFQGIDFLLESSWKIYFIYFAVFIFNFKF